MSVNFPCLLCLWLIFISLPCVAFAEEGFWQLDGKLQAGAWSSNRSLDNHEGVFPATVALKGTVNFTENLRLFTEGRIGHSDYFAGEDRFAVARELYLDYALENDDIRIGKQLLPWGRADRINPTDSLTSRDYRWLAPEEEDQRFGNTGIRYAHHFGDYTVTSIWLPYMRSSRIPLSPQYTSQVAIHQPNNQDNFAVKVDRTGERFDASISFYSGIDTAPSLDQNAATVALSNYRIQRYGADMAWAFDAYTLRYEFAYTQTGKSHNEFSGKKYNYVQAVIGIERQFVDNLNVIFQVVWQSAFDWRNPALWAIPEQRQLALFQQIINQQPAEDFIGIGYRVSQKFLNETLELELSGLGLTANQGWLMRPRVRYQINDEYSMALGCDYYAADNDNTIFGRLKNNKTVFLEFSYAFDAE